MDKIKNELIVIGIFIVVLFVNNLVLTTKITNRVLNELKRDYVPGPYEPGFDPDKVPPKLAN